MKRRAFLAALAAVVVSAKRSFAMATGAKREWIQYSRLDESEWVESEPLPNRDVLAKAADAGDTTLFPMFPDRFQPRDIVHCPRTGENFRVLSLGVEGGGMYVERGIGCWSCAMRAGEPIWILGSAAHEGSTAERTPEAPSVRRTPPPYQPYQRGVSRSVAANRTQPRQFLNAQELKDWVGE